MEFDTDPPAAAAMRRRVFDMAVADKLLIGGMHMRLAEFPELADTARRLGRRLIDVRSPPPNIPVATGRKRDHFRMKPRSI